METDDEDESFLIAAAEQLEAEYLQQAAGRATDAQSNPLHHSQSSEREAIEHGEGTNRPHSGANTSAHVQTKLPWVRIRHSADENLGTGLTQLEGMPSSQLQGWAGVRRCHETRSSTLLLPRDPPVRDYQKEIISSAVLENTLVSLPTGLGKTLIAAVLMQNFLRWFPGRMVVFLAPTKPLVHQQRKACQEIMGLKSVMLAEMTGEQPIAQRQKLWSEKSMVFATPQILENDLSKGDCPAQRVILAVVDEAHKATGRHAMVKAIEQLTHKVDGGFRVLALTATPGADISRIQGVVSSLCISKLEFRCESDPQIAQYLHDKNREVISISQPAHLQTLCDRIRAVALPLIKRLQVAKHLHFSKHKVTADALIMARKAMTQSQPQGESTRSQYTGFADFGVAIAVLRCAEELETIAFSSALSGLEKLQAEAGDVRSGAKKDVPAQAPFTSLVADLKALTQDQEKVHPKVWKLSEVVRDHMQQHRGCGPNSTRVMVFVSSRSGMDEICAALEKLRPLVKAQTFVGQAGSAGNKGMRQSEQQELLRTFKAGEINTLVCTCIAEEGLDFGEVDLIVEYDTVKSAIRQVQRAGRTGRKRAGRVVSLVMEGSEELALVKAERKVKGASKSLRKLSSNGASKLRFFRQNVALLPRLPRFVEFDFPREHLADTPPKVARNARKRKSGVMTADDDGGGVGEALEWAVEGTRDIDLEPLSLLAWPEWQQAPSATHKIGHSAMSKRLVRFMMRVAAHCPSSQAVAPSQRGAGAVEDEEQEGLQEHQSEPFATLKRQRTGMMRRRQALLDSSSEGEASDFASEVGEGPAGKEDQYSVQGAEEEQRAESRERSDHASDPACASSQGVEAESVAEAAGDESCVEIISSDDEMEAEARVSGCRDVPADKIHSEAPAKSQDSAGEPAPATELMQIGDAVLDLNRVFPAIDERILRAYFPSPPRQGRQSAGDPYQDDSDQDDSGHAFDSGVRDNGEDSDSPDDHGFADDQHSEAERFAVHDTAEDVDEVGLIPGLAATPSVGDRVGVDEDHAVRCSLSQPRQRGVQFGDLSACQSLRQGENGGESHGRMFSAFEPAQDMQTDTGPFDALAAEPGNTRQAAQVPSGSATVHHHLHHETDCGQSQTQPTSTSAHASAEIQNQPWTPSSRTLAKGPSFSSGHNAEGAPQGAQDVASTTDVDSRRSSTVDPQHSTPATASSMIRQASQSAPTTSSRSSAIVPKFQTIPNRFSMPGSQCPITICVPQFHLSSSSEDEDQTSAATAAKPYEDRNGRFTSASSSCRTLGTGTPLVAVQPASVRTNDGMDNDVVVSEPLSSPSDPSFQRSEGNERRETSAGGRLPYADDPHTAPDAIHVPAKAANGRTDHGHESDDESPVIRRRDVTKKRRVLLSPDDPAHAPQPNSPAEHAIGGALGRSNLFSDDADRQAPTLKAGSHGNTVKPSRVSFDSLTSSDSGRRVIQPALRDSNGSGKQTTTPLTRNTLLDSDEDDDDDDDDFRRGPRQRRWQDQAQKERGTTRRKEERQQAARREKRRLTEAARRKYFADEASQSDDCDVSDEDEEDESEEEGGAAECDDIVNDGEEDGSGSQEAATPSSMRGIYARSLMQSQSKEMGFGPLRGGRFKMNFRGGGGRSCSGSDEDAESADEEMEGFVVDSVDEEEEEEEDELEELEAELEQGRRRGKKRMRTRVLVGESDSEDEGVGERSQAEASDVVIQNEESAAQASDDLSLSPGNQPPREEKRGLRGRICLPKRRSASRTSVSPTGVRKGERDSKPSSRTERADEPRPSASSPGCTSANMVTCCSPCHQDGEQSRSGQDKAAVANQKCSVAGGATSTALAPTSITSGVNIQHENDREASRAASMHVSNVKLPSAAEPVQRKNSAAFVGLASRPACSAFDLGDSSDEEEAASAQGAAQGPTSHMSTTAAPTPVSSAPVDTRGCSGEGLTRIPPAFNAGGAGGAKPRALSLSTNRTSKLSLGQTSKLSKPKVLSRCPPHSTSAERLLATGLDDKEGNSRRWGKL